MSPLSNSSSNTGLAFLLLWLIFQFLVRSKNGELESSNFVTYWQLNRYLFQELDQRRAMSRQVCQLWNTYIKKNARSYQCHINLLQHSECCGYGMDGKASKIGYDCVIIPGASKVTMKLAPSAICGKSVGLVTATGTASKTICSKDSF